MIFMMHLCTRVHFLARCEFRTYDCSFQNKWTLEAVKLWCLLFLFTQIYRVSIKKTQFSHNYLKNIMLWLQNNINMLGDLKTDAFER